MSDEQIRFSIGNPGPASGMSVPEAAMLAEKLGYDGFHTGASLLGYGDGYDGIIVMAQAAAVTERVLLDLSVLILPFYHPLMLGKQLATLDHMSKGRVYLAVGVGERPKIHEIYGVPMHERGARANEYIHIMKGMWTQPTYHYSGKFFQFGDIPQESTYQKPHIPIWIGGRIGGVEIGPDGQRRFKSKRAAMRRAGCYGDGWIPYFTTPDVYKGTVQTVTADAKQCGRGNHPITMAMHLFGAVNDDYDEALQLAAEYNPFGGHSAEFSARYDLVGTPKDWIKRLQDYVDAGARHFNIQRPLVPPKETRKQMERIAKEVIPHFK